ncbi:MAG: beta-N-acetylhexosaminidase [Candidatus Polarisedimenticolaceae bacterium]|nr:beta-N-acetylhexosaminidase [Candidatus Polarisedimenticolaceae bacterium]
MSLGPIMLDLEGVELSANDRELLRHPAVGGVILFSRNYDSPEQLHALTTAIHQLREPNLLIAVDQEGGRVQRFRDGFSRLPPAAWFGQLYQKSAQHAKEVTQQIAWLMASELRCQGVDFSFAPVLDLGLGVSQVIGDRAFDKKPTIVAELARAWIYGAREAGMASVGKHFPGHGAVAEDSHHALPVDQRPYQDLQMEDLLPFERLINCGLEAIMPAHVIYQRIAPDLAGFSPFWLQTVLRERLKFQGVIFSDDLAMAATEGQGSFSERADAAINAGCDMVLVCNNRPAAEQVVDALADYSCPVAQLRLLRMHGRQHQSRSELHLNPRWKKALEALALFEQSNAMSLDILPR